MQCEMRELKVFLKGKMLIHLFQKIFTIFFVKIEGLTFHKGLVPKADGFLMHLCSNSVNIYQWPPECLSL